MGMIVENVVAQMLTANGHKLYFYSNPSRDDASSRMEVDFLIAKSRISNRHNISPIEACPPKNHTVFTGALIHLFHFYHIKLCRLIPGNIDYCSYLHYIVFFINPDTHNNFHSHSMDTLTAPRFFFRKFDSLRHS